MKGPGLGGGYQPSLSQFLKEYVGSITTWKQIGGLQHVLTFPADQSLILELGEGLQTPLPPPP